MKNEKYNGWTNFETWVTALWLDNERPSYEHWREVTKQTSNEAKNAEQVKQGIWTVEQAARFRLADKLKADIEHQNPIHEASMYADLLSAAICEIDFQEIAAHYLDDIDDGEQSDAITPSGNGLIYAYTRATALADGVLKDVTKTSQEAGIKYATVLTAAAWATCVTVPPDVTWNDEAGRLWDVVTVLRFAMQTARNADRVDFQVSVQTSALAHETVNLYAVCHPDDDGRTPVITVMLRGED